MSLPTGPLFDVVIGKGGEEGDVERVMADDADRAREVAAEYLAPGEEILDVTPVRS